MEIASGREVIWATAWLTRIGMVQSAAWHAFRSSLVVGEAFIRAYHGMPLMTSDGLAVGARCAIDTLTCRLFTSAQIAVLAGFARLVVVELELRRVAITDQ